MCCGGFYLYVSLILSIFMSNKGHGSRGITYPNIINARLSREAGVERFFFLYRSLCRYGADEMRRYVRLSDVCSPDYRESKNRSISC